MRIGSGKAVRSNVSRRCEPAGTRLRSRRGNYDAGLPLCYETFGEMAQAAAAGKFTIPIARTFPLEQWREAMEISMNGKASGKLLLLPTTPSTPGSP